MKQLVESWRLVNRLACFLYFFRLDFRWDFDFVSQHIVTIVTISCGLESRQLYSSMVLLDLSSRQHADLCIVRHAGLKMQLSAWVACIERLQHR